MFTVTAIDMLRTRSSCLGVSGKHGDSHAFMENAFCKRLWSMLHDNYSPNHPEIVYTHFQGYRQGYRVLFIQKKINFF